MSRQKPLRAYTNILRMRVNAALRRTTVDNYPVVAYVEPTLACNLRCPACPTGLQLELRPAATLKPEMFRALVDEIGDYVFHLYMYNWGEPFLHKDTPELIAYAKQKHMTITLSSNMSVPLSDDYVDRIVQSGLDTLVVSLDGTTPETYGLYRRKGDFDLVRRNLRRLQDAKQRLGRTTPELQWQFLVFRHNEHQIPEARAVYREWGADTLLLAPPELPRDEAFGLEAPTIPEFNRYRDDHPVHARERAVLKEGRACSWLYGVFVMNPNGQVSPCCATADEKDDFSRYEGAGGFRKAWNSDRYRSARDFFVRLGKGEAPAAAAAAAPESLLCHTCPIVGLQDRADAMVARVGYECLRDFVRRFDLRRLAQFVAMGGPSLYAVQRLIAHLRGRYRLSQAVKFS